MYPLHSLLLIECSMYDRTLIVAQLDEDNDDDVDSVLGTDW